MSDISISVHKEKAKKNRDCLCWESNTDKKPKNLLLLSVLHQTYKYVHDTEECFCMKNYHSWKYWFLSSLPGYELWLMWSGRENGTVFNVFLWKSKPPLNWSLWANNINTKPMIYQYCFVTSQPQDIVNEALEAWLPEIYLNDNKDLPVGTTTTTKTHSLYFEEQYLKKGSQLAML